MKIRPICKNCADKLNLEPLAGGFICAEPCADCGSLMGTCFTDLMKKKRYNIKNENPRHEQRAVARISR